MKKITILLITLFAAICLNAQTEITPAQVIFNCDGNKVTLKEAKTDGTALVSNLEIEVVFAQSELAKLNTR